MRLRTVTIFLLFIGWVFVITKIDTAKAQPSEQVIFSRDLGIGSHGTDVKQLQAYLNNHGTIVILDKHYVGFYRR